MGFLRIGTFGGVSGHVILGRYLWKEGREGRNEGGKEFTLPSSTFSLKPALLAYWCIPLLASPQADHGSEGAGRECLHGQQMPGVLGSLLSQAAVAYVGHQALPLHNYVVVQSLSGIQFFAAPWTAPH